MPCFTQRGERHRELILERLRAEPGATIAALADLLGIAKNSVRQHMSFLARHRQVWWVRDGRILRYYAGSREVVARGVAA